MPTGRTAIAFGISLGMWAITVACGDAGANVEAGPASGGAGGQGASAPLQVGAMSFNIRLGLAPDGDDHWNLRQDLVVDVLRGSGTDDVPGWDVVGVQEGLVFQLMFIDDELPGFARAGVGRNDGLESGEFSAIYYLADRFELLEEETFWLSNTPEVPGSTSWGNTITRICTWVRLRERETGDAFYVFNAHLDHQSATSRERAVELIADRIASRANLSDPVIFTGDFNTSELSRPIRYLVGEEARATDPSDERNVAPAPPLVLTYRDVHPDETSVGTFNGFAGNTDGAMIDFVFASPEPSLEVLDAQIDHYNVDGRYPSDHFPVTATLRWTFSGGE